MKISKRLLAVLMSVVMVLTIVPLGLFAFAGEEPEPQDPPKPGSAENPIIIHNYSELQAVMNGLAAPTEETPEPTYPINGYYKLDAEGTFNSDAALVEWLETNGVALAEELNITDRYHDVIYAKATSYEAGTKYYIDNKGQTELTEYVTPENYTEYYVDNGGGEPYSLATSYTPEYRHYKDAEGTVEVPVIERDYATYYVKFADAYWEAAQITDLTDAQKADLIAENNLEFVYTTPTTTFRGQLDGNNVTFSGLKIKSVSVEGNVYAGLVSNMAGGSVIKNLTMDETCLVTIDGEGSIIAGSFVAVSNISGLQNLKSSATINVTNKLYAPKSAEDTSNKYSTVVGGLAGTGLGLVISKSIFDGSVNFKYDEASFDDANLKDVYEKTSVNIGGIAGAFGMSDKDCKADDATLTSTYLGVAVKAGKLNATNNDYTLLAEYTEDAQTYLDSEEGYKKVDIFGTAQTTEPDENGYQLVKATDTASGITYAYIRTATCAHDTTVSKIDNSDTMCPSFGAVVYYQCDKCEKYFEDEACTTEITLSDTSDKGHTWSDWETVTPATFTAVGSETRHCTNEGCTAEETREIPVVSTEIQLAESHGTYKIDSGLLVTSFPLTTEGLLVSDLLKNLISLPEGANYVVKDSEGNVLTTSDTICTGCKVYISGYEGNALTIAVRGDVDGDGAVGIGDYIDIRNEIMGTFVIEGDAKRAAADTDNDGKQANIGDYVDIRNLIMSMSK